MKPLHITIIRYPEQDDSNKPKSNQFETNQIETNRTKSNSIVNI